MSSMIANPVYRYLLLLTCLLRDLMLVVTAERSADGISIYSGVQSVFPSRFRGGWACSVCTQHGILSSCCCWLPGFAATRETVSIVDTVVSLTLRIVLFVSDNYVSKCICTHTHTHLTALCPGLPMWAGTRKVKTNLDFTEAKDSEWQWHQLGHMRVCTSLQTENHASTPPLSFYRPDALPAVQPTASKHWRDK